MIKVDNLSLQYNSQTVLDHISFSFKEGQIIGLLGPNGAGKSSIIKVLAGLVFPNSGTLMFKEKRGYKFSDLKKHCGYLIDSPAFYPYLTAHQNLSLVKTINDSKVSIEALLLKVGLVDVERKKVRNFSTGMKQRLAIAQALLRSPEILILDEPFNGLDPNGFQDLIVLIKTLNDEGVTIIISSHLLNEIELFADTFVLIHEGKVALNLTKAELENSKKKVTFKFDNALNDEAITYINLNKGVMKSDFSVVLRLHPNEIANAVKSFVDVGSLPINVETHTILEEKYFEITA